MKKITFFSFPILLVFMFVKCDKKSECFTPPEPFRIIVNDEEGINLFDPVSSINEYHLLINGTTIEELDTKVLSFLDETTSEPIYYLECADAPWRSLDGDTDFILRIGNLPDDTLFINVVKEDSGKCTSYNYANFKFNGAEILEIDKRIEAYVVNK